MSADALGKLVWVAGTALMTACVVGPSMYFYNRNNVSSAFAAGEGVGAAAEKARQEQQTKQRNADLEQLNAEVEENRRMFKLSLAMLSVGFACAASYGPVSEEDKVVIEEYILGVSRYAAPRHIKLKSVQASQSPPDVKTAYTHASHIADPDSWPYFDQLVEVMMDLKVSAGLGLTAFRTEWYFLRATA